MKIEEIKDMLPHKPERMESVAEPKKSQLVKATYDVVGAIFEVYKQLGTGLPEYIYKKHSLSNLQNRVSPSTRSSSSTRPSMGNPLKHT